MDTTLHRCPRKHIPANTDGFVPLCELNSFRTQPLPNYPATLSIPDDADRRLLEEFAYTLDEDLTPSQHTCGTFQDILTCLDDEYEWIRYGYREDRVFWGVFGQGERQGRGFKITVVNKAFGRSTRESDERNVPGVYEWDQTAKRRIDVVVCHPHSIPRNLWWKYDLWRNLGCCRQPI